MSYVDTWQGYTAEELATRNGASLLAHQLITEHRNAIEATERHNAEIARIRATLSDAERIGLRVLRLEAKGRKTVRIADLIEESQ